MNIRGRWLSLVAVCAALCGCHADITEVAENATPPPVEVRVASVRRGPIVETLSASGETAALSTLRLASPIAGRVLSVAARPGDQLAAGTVAARVIALENEAAVHGLAILDTAGMLSGAEREQAQRLQHDLAARSIALRVPFAAVVSDRLHNPGEQVAPNDVLLELFDPGSLYVVAQVPLSAAARVRNGNPVEVEVGGAVASGTVTAIVTAVVPQSLTVPVQISLTTPLEPAWLHAAARCRIVVERHPDALLILRSAVMSSLMESEATVMVAVDDRAQERHVQLGLRSGQDVEVIAGLAVGDTVLVDGQYALPDGALIHAIQSDGE